MVDKVNRPTLCIPPAALDDGKLPHRAVAVAVADNQVGMPLVAVAADDRGD